MAKGFSIPVGVDKSGGASLEDDPLHLSTILQSALSLGEDDNPFQNLGLDPQIIFAVNDPAAQARAKNSVERILRKYSDRVRLDTSVPMSFSKDGEHLRCEFSYINLDTGERDTFSGVVS